MLSSFRRGKKARSISYYSFFWNVVKTTENCVFELEHPSKTIAKISGRVLLVKSLKRGTRDRKYFPSLSDYWFGAKHGVCAGIVELSK